MQTLSKQLFPLLIPPSSLAHRGAFRSGWQVRQYFFVGQNLGGNVRTGGFDADTIKAAVSASHSSLQSREQRSFLTRSAMSASSIHNMSGGFAAVDDETEFMEIPNLSEKTSGRVRLSVYAPASF